MKKKEKLIILGILFFIIGVVGLILYKNNLGNYIIIAGAIELIILTLFVMQVLENPSEDNTYKKNLNQILRSYANVLVESDDYLDLSNKNVIRVTNFDDLIDAQMEFRKPIYFKNSIDSCGFILLDDNEALVYIIKRSEDTASALENIIEVMKINKDEVVEYSMKDYKVEEVEDTMKDYKEEVAEDTMKDNKEEVVEDTMKDYKVEEVVKKEKQKKKKYKKNTKNIKKDETKESDEDCEVL